MAQSGNRSIHPSYSKELSFHVAEYLPAQSAVLTPAFSDWELLWATLLWVVFSFFVSSASSAHSWPSNSTEPEPSTPCLPPRWSASAGSGLAKEPEAPPGIPRLHLPHTTCSPLSLAIRSPSSPFFQRKPARQQSRQSDPGEINSVI